MIDFSQKGIIHLGITLVLLLGLGVGVYLVQQTQIFKPRAGNDFSLANFQKALGSKKGDPNYDSQYDANGDGKITAIDYSVLLPRLTAKQGLSPDSVESLTNQLLEKSGRKKEGISGRSDEQQITLLKEIAQRRKEMMLKAAEESPRQFLGYALPKKIKDSFPKEVQGLIEEEKELRGTLAIYHADDFDNKKSRLIYKLEAPDQEYNLHFSESPQNSLSGTEVRVKGVTLDTKMVVSLRRDLRTQGGGNNGSYVDLSVLSSPPPLSTKGEQKTAVLLLKFSDTPKSDSELTSFKDSVQNVVFGSGPSSINGFYRENSYNLISFSSNVYGWYTIPFSRGSPCEPGQWAEEADAIAKRERINLDGFSRVVYVFSDGSYNCYSGGFGSLGAGGRSGRSRSWIFGNQPVGVYIHELGHNLGLEHANAWDCGGRRIGSDNDDCKSIEYGDPTDVMGTGIDYYPVGGNLHFNGPHKLAVGWITTDRVQTVGASGIYRINHLGSTRDGPQILKIKKAEGGELFSPAGYYYVSLRNPSGFDANLPDSFREGSSIHLWDDRPDYGTKLIDVAYSSRSFYDGGLIDGVYFIDLDGVSLIQQNRGEGSATLSVTIGSVPCKRFAPRIQLQFLSPQASSSYWALGLPDETAKYLVEIYNTDRSVCPSTTFNLSATGPEGWRVSLNNSSLVKAPRTPGYTELSFTPPPNTPNGIYTITVEATDSFHSASFNLAYFVYLEDNPAGRLPFPSPSPSPSPTPTPSPTPSLSPSVTPSSPPLGYSCSIDQLKAAFFSKRGDVKYNPACDINNDGRISVSDYSALLRRR